MSQETPEHISWRGMRERCFNTSSPWYPKYGGAGITVCKTWNNFHQFLLDMGPREPGMTLERLDNDKDYCKANCIWDTRFNQAHNRGVYANNSSGVSGVRKSRGYWMARGTHNYLEYHLYCGHSFDDAVAARLQWEEEINFRRKLA